jgi:DNA-binding MarR family transcriptional regulator
VSVHDLRLLLDRIPDIHDPCDLDVLLFFYRHPRALLTSEKIVAFVGYDRERVVKSVEGLIEAGLLTRRQNPAHAARLYVLELRGASSNLLLTLLKLAATPQGRKDALRLLAHRPEGTPGSTLRRASTLRIA